MRFRVDPGPCPICGVEHSACTATPGPISIQQLPQRDAAAASEPSPDAAPLVAQQVQTALPPGEFTTGTYRGSKKR